MKRHVLLYVLVLLALISLVAACRPGSEPTAEPPDTGDEATEEPSSDGETVQLRLWTHQNGAFNAGYEALIEAYQAEHPEVEITLETFEYDTYIQTLATAMPAGEEADIIQLFGTWTAQYAERLVPVPEDVMTVAEAEATFYPSTLGGYIVDGVLYGMPQETNLEYGGVLVNGSMVESADLAFPPEWESMEDVLADAQALTQVDDDGVMTVAGFHFSSSDPAAYSFLAGILQRGGDYWNADGSAFTFNTPEAKEQLQWMVDAANEWKVVDPVFFNDEENWIGDAFFEGRVGIGYIGTWMIAEGQAYYPDFENEWDYVWLPPTVAGVDPVFAAASGWGMAVSPNSQHQDVAWDFAKFVTTNTDNALSWNLASGTIPAIPEVAESEEIAAEMPWVTNALDILPHGRYLGQMPDADLVVYEIIYPHVLSAMQGVETVDEALQYMDDEANASLE